MSDKRNTNIRKAASNKKKKKRRSQKELVLYTRMKAVFCMLIFAFAVVVCVKVIQQLSTGNAVATAPQASAIPESAAAGSTGSGIVTGQNAYDDNESGNADTKKGDKDSSSENDDRVPQKEHDIQVIDGITYVDGIMIANKSYPLPASYDPGLLPETEQAFYEMAQAAAQDGITLFISSGYRSHFSQEQLYNEYVWRDGKEAADTYSSRPGYSEHQTGYTIDVNNPSDDFRGTPEAKWIAEHCSDYGFIVRYPEGKEDITGYEYEPWHIRYLGVETAKAVEASGLCLEEYLGIDSKYKDE